MPIFFCEKRFFVTCFFIYFNIVFSESKHRLEKEDFGAKVVGGKSVALEKYPYAVQFFNIGSLCGGVILSSWSILTSAHCLEINKDVNDMRVQIGSKYIYDFNAQKHEVETFVTHEDYSKEIPFENDIAIVFVKERFVFGHLAKRGVLVDNNKWMNPKEKHFVVTGWGWQEYGGDLSEMSLMMTYLSFVPIKVCSNLHNLTMSDDMFCLYGEGVRDTCRGDSGGGVLWHGKLVGLTSHGDGCAKKDKPSVYTNLWYHRKWIKKKMDWFVHYYCKNDMGSKRMADIVRHNL